MSLLKQAEVEQLFIWLARTRTWKKLAAGQLIYSSVGITSKIYSKKCFTKFVSLESNLTLTSPFFLNVIPKRDYLL